MSLQMAKQRRLAALNSRTDERVLVKPALHGSQVNLPDEGTVADFLIDSLIHGCTADQLVRETGWSKQTVMVNLYKVAKKSGVGIRRRGETLNILMPQGTKNMYPRAKVVASESTVRSMAADVVIPAEERLEAPDFRTRVGAAFAS